MFKFSLALLSLLLVSNGALANTAGCEGKINGKRFSSVAHGNMNNRQDGMGFVKIDGREVARFDGDAASISYLRRTFSISNDRGDMVQGKLNNIITGRATLRKLTIPSLGIDVRNIPVKCWMRK